MCYFQIFEHTHTQVETITGSTTIPTSFLGTRKLIIFREIRLSVQRSGLLNKSNEKSPDIFCWMYSTNLESCLGLYIMLKI